MRGLQLDPADEELQGELREEYHKIADKIRYYYMIRRDGKVVRSYIQLSDLCDMAGNTIQALILLLFAFYWSKICAHRIHLMKVRFRIRKVKKKMTDREISYCYRATSAYNFQYERVNEVVIPDDLKELILRKKGNTGAEKNEQHENSVGI